MAARRNAFFSDFFIDKANEPIELSWAPCWPHEHCYHGIYGKFVLAHDAKRQWTHGIPWKIIAFRMTNISDIMYWSYWPHNESNTFSVYSNKSTKATDVNGKDEPDNTDV